MYDELRRSADPHSETTSRRVGGGGLLLVCSGRAEEQPDPGASISPHLLATLAQGKGQITFVGASPDGRWLASTSDQGVIQLWHMANWEPDREITAEGRGILGAAFVPEGHVLAAGCRDGALRLWDLADGQVTQTLRASSCDLTR